MHLGNKFLPCHKVVQCRPTLNAQDSQRKRSEDGRTEIPPTSSDANW